MSEGEEEITVQRASLETRERTIFNHRRRGPSDHSSLGGSLVEVAWTRREFESHRRRPSFGRCSLRDSSSFRLGILDILVAFVLSFAWLEEVGGREMGEEARSKFEFGFDFLRFVQFVFFP